MSRILRTCGDEQCQKDIVHRLDSDGDAPIKFDDHDHWRWVTRKNYPKLQVVD